MSHRASRAATLAKADEPIDLDYLRTQTCGDAALEADLLDLFSRQARMILRDLATAAAPPRRESDLLHTLCGSARAVGAWEIAAGAEQLERITRGVPDDTDPGRRPRPEALMAALDSSVDRACRAIDELRATAAEDRSERDPTRR